jgi:acetyltransferase
MGRLSPDSSIMTNREWKAKNMSVHNLDRVFQPKSIAVVGASEKRGSVGTTIFKNLIAGGFKGPLYPVNPNHGTISGYKAYPALQAAPPLIDLAVIATPIESVPSIVQAAAQAGVGGVVIISAGGKEIGTRGRKVEQAITAAAQGSDLRIIGPNCLGIINSGNGLNASFARRMPLPGKMAFISQSGAICTSVLDLSLKEKIGFSYFISLGSMLDVDFGDMIDYLGGQSDVNSIVMYVESLTRFRNFMSAARSVSRVNPIIALKAGRTRAGAKAATSHTGALAGDDDVYDAAFKRAGIVRVKTFEELFDCAELVAKQPRPRGPALAIVTNAGGPAVMATDSLSDYGVEPAALSTATIEKLDKILPPHWSHGNPVDMLGEASPESYRQVVEICLDAPEINGLLIMLSPVAMADPTDVATTIAGLIHGKSFPVLAAWIGGNDVEGGREVLNQSGVPTFNTPERAVRAFMDLYKYARNIEMLQEIPPRLPHKLEFDRLKAGAVINEALENENRLLTEVEAKGLLSAYGIPVNMIETAKNAEDSVQKAGKIGYPVVLKIHSRDISHKTDAKGVKLDLRSDSDVREAFNEIMDSAHKFNPKAVIDGVTIQSMVSDKGIELILGAKKDRDFGPVILFGMGGVMTEILADRAVALPPINRLLARKLMEETKVFNLLKGHRGQPPVNLELLEEILVRLSQLVTDFAEIEELDINPLIVSKDRIVAVDARVILGPSQVQAPHHLVISPYPNEHEARVSVNGLENLFIRPIRPEDAPLLEKLFESLSERSVYMRFFTHLKRMDHRMLAHFTQIDYDRHIALTAISETDAEEKMIGVARVLLERNLKKAEFSAAVGDQWQGKGIGAELLKRCIAIAKRRGVKTIYGIVLAGNTQMLALSRKMGFRIKNVSRGPEYELCLEL